VESNAATSQIPQLRSLLGAFLFSGDDVHKKVSVLSGGEKSRLALAKILLNPSNFLVLDEPTNHLDRAGRDVLLNALNQYSGTILIVSHDRYFLDGLVDEIWEMKNQTLRRYPGNYSYYHRVRMEEQEKLMAQQSAQQADILEDNTSETKKVAVKKTKEQKRQEAEERQQQYQKRKKIETKLKKIMSAIEQREKRKTELETLLSDTEVYHDGDKMRDIMKEYREINAELPILYQEWEQIEKNGATESP
jgi:ATP-binding cassette subfamily F protein 3